MIKTLTTLIFLLTYTFLDAAEFADISVESLKKAIDSQNVAIIDVNGAKSYKKSHIPGAIDFSIGEERLKEKLPKDKNTLIVAYCGGPGCRAYLKGARAASELGYVNVMHLSAGISGWKKDGQKVNQK